MTIDLTAKVKAIKRLRRRVSLPAMAELRVWQIITPKATLNLGKKKIDKNNNFSALEITKGTQQCEKFLCL